jgi:hypoxanthine phosphoribosyltransferase
MTESVHEAPVQPVAKEPGIRVLFTAEQIAQRVRELGLEVGRDYEGKHPLFVGVLKGACMFQCDLARATPFDVELDFLSVASYGAGTTSSGTVRPDHGSARRHRRTSCGAVRGSRGFGLSVLVHSGSVRSRGAASLKVATLLDKRPCRKYRCRSTTRVGRLAPSSSSVRHGCAERYRNLPYVGVLEEA